MGVTESQFDYRNCRNQAVDLGLKIHWQGHAVDEKGILLPSPSGRGAGGEGERVIVQVDPRYFRPTEVGTLLGDPAKAKAKLGWTPKVTFSELVAEMVREDLKSAERDELVKKHGYKAMDYNE